MERPIRQGDRGPAVEDVQKRLLRLGYDLGPTGVDGVFLGATLTAVTQFQHEHGLSEDGLVGPETWSSLVDATFTLGDRLLYLRYPYLHGNDVLVLQRALNALGFSCGAADGIFGAFTERAVREFQVNTGQPSDGIAGAETVRAITQLRHVWADKDGNAPDALHVAAVRAAEVLARTDVTLCALDAAARDVAARFENLAQAAEDRARVRVVDDEDDVSAGVVLRIAANEDAVARPGVPEVWREGLDDAHVANRLAIALSSAEGGRPAAAVVLGASELEEHDAQRVAVGLLDGVCAYLARVGAEHTGV